MTRLLALLSVTAVALLLTGCGASVTVYDYYRGGTRYGMYEIRVDAATVEKMEETATTDSDGNKYTVSGYLYELFTSFGYEPISASNTDEYYTVSYRRAEGRETELDRFGTKLEFTNKYTQTPFIRTYHSVSPSPFNGLREAYDNIPSERASTILEWVKNGAVARDEFGERVVSFPSITEAFPYLVGKNPDGLLLNYVYEGSRRMQTSGVKTGEYDSTAQYMFSRYFDDSETTIELMYERPVTYGWYLAALAIGAAALAIIRTVQNYSDKKHITLLI